MNLLHISSEMAPYAKTGGLGDVVGALPRYLARRGHDVRAFIPLYDTVDTTRLDLEPLISPMTFDLGPHRIVTKIFRDRDNPTAYFVHCPGLYGRGSIYTHNGDEHLRFLALSVAALTACQHMRFSPDVIHCHDWQASMVPLLLKVRFGWDRLFQGSRTLLTIDNMNYQGGFSSDIVPDLGIDGSEHLLHQELLAQGRVNFLLHGILYADGVSTVSPTYAHEIQTSRFGAGMDPFLRTRSSTVVGILNGVDYEEWSTETDPHIPFHYSADDLSGKEKNKVALLQAMGLPYVQGVPLIGVVSRMAGQKGFDLVPGVLPGILAGRDVQLVALGSGESRLEGIFHRLQQYFPRQVSYYRGFSNPLAHFIEAGADIFLMPSAYEPCGLNQMYSLRYGTIPVVHRTGGLADTVRQVNPATGDGTGFVFDHHDEAGLRWALTMALRCYRNRPLWRKLIANAMAMDYSWEQQCRIYEELYSRLMS